MTKYAIIENNVVINVVECDNNIEDAEKILQMFYPDCLIQKEKFENEKIYIGGEYIGQNFATPRPYPSWDYVNNEWVSKKQYPQDKKTYVWNERMNNWTTKIPERLVYPSL